jgi:hypothetical protein
MFSLALSRAARAATVRTTPVAAMAFQHQWSAISTRFYHATVMAQAKLNVEALAAKVDLKGVNVLVRVDLNVPLAKVS